MPTIIPLRSGTTGTCDIVLDSGLPEHLIAPLKFQCRYEIIEQDRYYLLSYQFHASIKYVCQRCLEESKAELAIENTLALCINDDDAEKLMSEFEPVVVKGRSFELEPLLLDELYLSAPLKHSLGSVDNSFHGCKCV